MRLVLFLFLLCIGNNTYAQSNIGIASTYGRIIKHTKKIYFTPTQPSFNVELNYSLENDGTKYWHSKFANSGYGVTLTYIQPGDSVPGRIISLMPNVYFSIWQHKRFKLFSRIGTGPAIATSHWRQIPLGDTIDNYLGSTWNMYASLLVAAKYKLTPRWEAGLGYTLSHTSNVGTVKPNYGVNLVGTFVQVNYLPNAKISNKKVKAVPPKGKYNRWLARAAYSISEYGPANGPLRPSYTGSFFYSHHLRYKHKLYTGLSVEYNTKLYLYLLQLSDPTVNKRAKATSVNYIIGNEFTLGKFSIPLEVGIYLNDPVNKQSWYNQRFGLLYYPRFAKTNTYKGMSLGLMMKSANFTADFIEVVGNYAF